ncbi:hypothetical protein Acr_04g0002850 [Actinidia rufa]|uniref:Uncharacterized protein n=1 Tax=Actinidia rufa TaxID=165716 RepID=A0A7J0EIU2_9ERIC|nr:hypothetical protein Acr_04g0002850 [Actinidia rufa]
MCARTFMDKQPHEAYSYFDYLANFDSRLGIHRDQNPEGRPNQQGKKYQLKEVDDVNARLATMARKLEAIEFTKINAVGSISSARLARDQGPKFKLGLFDSLVESRNGEDDDDSMVRLGFRRMI